MNDLESMVKYLNSISDKLIPTNYSLGQYDNLPELYRVWLESPNIVWVGKPSVGIAMAIVSPYFTNPTLIVAYEFLWYGESPRKTIQLLRELEEKVKELGISKLIIGNGYGTSSDSTRQKLGYTYLDTLYIKDL